jgi:DNA-binding response OmpR family regulator
MPRIVIADDDPDIRDLVSFKLTSAGFDVETFADGEAALQSALGQVPDLMLLDVMMPKMTGTQVVAEIRRHDATAQVPVILLTARSKEEDVERGFDAGADDYMIKPFSPRELVSRTRAALGRTTTSGPDGDANHAPH